MCVWANVERCSERGGFFGGGGFCVRDLAPHHVFLFVFIRTPLAVSLDDQSAPACKGKHSLGTASNWSARAKGLTPAFVTGQQGRPGTAAALKMTFRWELKVSSSPFFDFLMPHKCMAGGGVVRSCPPEELEEAVTQMWRVRENFARPFLVLNDFFLPLFTF